MILENIFVKTEYTSIYRGYEKWHLKGFHCHSTKLHDDADG